MNSVLKAAFLGSLAGLGFHEAKKHGMDKKVKHNAKKMAKAAKL
jgi:hypothetical protein